MPAVLIQLTLSFSRSRLMLSWIIQVDLSEAAQSADESASWDARAYRIGLRDIVLGQYFLYESTGFPKKDATF